MKKLLPIFILLLFVGCKPKQIIQERVVTKIDSTAVLTLRGELNAREKQIETLTSDLRAASEENMRLQAEVSQHEINYDTAAPVDPETGKYPIASEIITESKMMLEKTIREFEILKQEYRREAEKLTQRNVNLELTVQALRDENRELKSKITPTTGFNFRLFLIGMFVGAVLIVIAYLGFKKILP